MHYLILIRIQKIIEDVCKRACPQKENKIAKKIYGSSLDQSWLPNILTQTIREN